VTVRRSGDDLEGGTDPLVHYRPEMPISVDKFP
jgi:hypothetical protein